MDKDSNEYQQQRDISRLWSAIIEIRTALIGIDGHNGLRRELKDFIQRYEARDDEIREWQKQIEDRWNNYLSRERADTCIGRKMLEEYIKEENERREQMKKVDTKMIEYKKAITVALITSGASVFVAVASILSSVLMR